MERNLLHKLLHWQASRHRQPLILKGARQVGKTHLLKEFGQRQFGCYHYFNFEEQNELKTIFEGNFDVNQILENLKLNRDQLEGGKELLIFDEIQHCPRALSSLKYFAENAPNIYICSAGSLIGVTLAEESFPVGKVDYLYLTPFKYSEYLRATDKWAYDVFMNTKESIPDAFQHQKLLDNFNIYSVVGGLPKGVLLAKELLAKKIDLYSELALFHDNMIRTYQSDFAKHAGKINALHIANTFSQIPSQLSSNIDGSTKRFVFKDVIPGLRGYAGLQGPINWLVKAGLIYKVKIAKKAIFPIESYTNENSFKLYTFDTGLLLRMLRVPYEVAASNSYGMHKGFVMENVVLSQLTEDDLDPTYCWQENKAEVDFLKIIQNKITPIEVKSSHRMASKSLASFKSRYAPEHSIKLSTNNFHFSESTKTWNIPVYYSEFIAGDSKRFRGTNLDPQ